MLCNEDLVQLELFRVLPQSRQEWVCERATYIELPAGSILAREGDPPRGLFILSAGRIDVTRISDGIDMPIGQHQAPAFFGEAPLLTEEPISVSLHAVTDCRLYELADADFRTLMHECRDFERCIFRVMATRLRGLESFVRSREKMAALGTLAAGLAHELNNPAAAVVRALKSVIPAAIELQRMNLLYGQSNIAPEESVLWLQARDAGYETIVNRPIDRLDLSDRAERLEAWLADYGVEQAWDLAEPLAAGGIEIETLERLTATWRDNPTELKDLGVRWLALSFDVMLTIKSGLNGAERIAALVQSMKSYSYLDRGALQDVDIHDGIEDTLRLFSHRFKQGVELHRNYDRQLPKITAYGSELNQVWTNLIDNAIDAMGGKGSLEITTARAGDLVQIDIADTGAGIPPEIRSRIFESFFTTKPVGEGSGLGLDIVRRIVENRHHGTISVTSQPGKTRFSIRLPVSARS